DILQEVKNAMASDRKYAQEIALRNGITLSVLYLPGEMAKAYGVEQPANQFWKGKTAPMLERKFSPEVLAAMRSNHLGACVVEEDAWAKGKQPTFTIHRKLEDAVARCEHIASNYLRAVSGKESGIMDREEQQDYAELPRKAEKETQQTTGAE